MKCPILFISALCLFVSCKKNSNDNDNNTDSSNNLLDKGLIAYYPFNGNANDESGNNYNLSVHEAVLSSNRFGEPSKAYSFNGTSSYMTIPKLLKADSLRELTVSFWVKPDTLKAQRMLSFLANPDAGFCSHFSEFSQINGVYLVYHEIVTSYYANGCDGVTNYDTIANPVGKWSHIVLVQRYNTENSSFKKYDYSHYFNGTRLKNAPTAQGSSGPNPMAIKLSLGGLIGNTVNGLNSFSGSIDDVRIYNRALSEEELLQLCNLKHE